MTGGTQSHTLGSSRCPASNEVVTGAPCKRAKVNAKQLTLLLTVGLIGRGPAAGRFFHCHYGARRRNEDRFGDHDHDGPGGDRAGAAFLRGKGTACHGWSGLPCHLVWPRSKSKATARGRLFGAMGRGDPKVFIVLYVINVLQLEALGFGWLTGLQMLTAILVYVPIAKLLDHLNRKPFVLLTFVFFALFPLVLANTPHLGWVTVAFVIEGLREVEEPARKALIVDLAHATARGRAVGIYYLVRGLVVFPASLVGGWLWTVNAQLPFYTAFWVGVTGVLAYVAWGASEDPVFQAKQVFHGGGKR